MPQAVPPQAIIPVTPPTLQACMDGERYLFDLKITEARLAFTNYDPEKASLNLNAILQDALATASKIPDIPQNLFRVEYEKPPPGSLEQWGHFFCRIPGALQHYVPDLSAPKNEHGRLAFVGDDLGNVYKLKIEAHIKKEFSAEPRKGKNDIHWLRVIPEKELTITNRQLYDITSAHLGKFGLTIQDHKHAFKESLTDDGEQASGKWHCDYDLHPDKVPRGPGGLWDIAGLRIMEIDPTTHERAKIWIPEPLLYTVFGACKVCWKHKDLCAADGGHEPRRMQIGQKRDPTQVTAANAQRRMSGKAKKTYHF